MTMLTNVPRPMTMSSIRVAMGALLAQFGGLIDRWVAAAIARRERQAKFVVQRYLKSRQLSEIGVCRYRIGDGPANAPERRRDDPGRPGSSQRAEPMSRR